MALRVGLGVLFIIVSGVAAIFAQSAFSDIYYHKLHSGGNATGLRV